MSKQVSPFAALTSSEKQIRWLEYQSIRLPYIETSLEEVCSAEPAKHDETKENIPPQSLQLSEPSRVVPADYHKIRHSQYDAVVARLKQAELKSRQYSKPS